MDCLDIITKFAVFSNVGILFWTSKLFKHLFISSDHNFVRDKDIKPITTDYSALDFLKSLIYVEHVLIIFQILLHIKVLGKPDWVINGERERSKLLASYYHDKEDLTNDCKRR